MQRYKKYLNNLLFFVLIKHKKYKNILTPLLRDSLYTFLFLGLARYYQLPISGP